ncbi:MAG: MarR family winged helix-turn-helix transcriptional regulator [Chitinophagales bacterium]|jgi:DNA-binding MarR family transcriptional regulator|nr:MarR family winged helix-turn-helix transcriptional regulator [Sphingobacteriales bacterium]
MEVNNSMDFLEAYCRFVKEQSKTKDIKLTDFAYWILNSENHKQKSSRSRSTESNSLSDNEVEEEISRLLILMYRHAKIHIKGYLSEFPEIVQEDFTYLYALKRAGSLTKTQLIEVNVHEKTSGLEIIRRLINNGLIEESIDDHDRRSKRLVLTKKGETMFYSIKAVTRKIAKLVTGKLSLKEKGILHTMLVKLDLFHQPLYLSRTKMNLDFALESYSIN